MANWVYALQGENLHITALKLAKLKCKMQSFFAILLLQPQTAATFGS
jgi:hypothetical protein